jgi:hypothetical protein
MTEQMYDSNIKLSNQEVEAAKLDLCDSDQLPKYRAIRKYWADPELMNQHYCLHSFAPTPGATPDKDGVYGFMKCRGTFQTEQAADERSEFLIRDVDSFHAIRTSYVGKPFPVIATKSKYILEVNEIDLKKKAVESVSTEIKNQKKADKQEMKDMKQREKELLKESKENEQADEIKTMEPIEEYTQLRVKRANLMWTYVETQKKMEQMKKSVLDAMEQIESFDRTDPELRNQYYDTYIEARRLTPDMPVPHDDNSFMRYLGDDLDDEVDFLRK